jgi:hypothetical protein
VKTNLQRANPPEICQALELDLVVKIRGFRRFTRRSDIDAIDEFALELSLASFKDNLDPGKVLGVVALAISAIASNFVGLTTSSLEPSSLK